jgi:hypothetical protein
MRQSCGRLDQSCGGFSPVKKWRQTSGPDTPKNSEITGNNREYQGIFEKSDAELRDFKGLGQE